MAPQLKHGIIWPQPETTVLAMLPSIYFDPWQLLVQFLGKQMKTYEIARSVSDLIYFSKVLIEFSKSPQFARPKGLQLVQQHLAHAVSIDKSGE